MDFKDVDENQFISGEYLSKEYILSLVSEEDIFKFVFGFEPIAFEYITSPFRPDKTPGAYFNYSPDGKLQFIDFGDPLRTHYDCFNAIEDKFGIDGFQNVLRFIKDHIVDDKKIITTPNKINPSRIKKNTGTNLDIRTRDFTINDKNYWLSYGIYRQHLIEDQVFATSSVNITKNGGIRRIKFYELAYSFCSFRHNRKKIYCPHNRNGRYRFITNCKSNDIGELNKLVPFGRQLIISKSYKDCRVLRNQGLNSVWFQNEGCVPSINTLTSLTQRFKKVIVFYDNDRAGVEASRKISSIINKYTNNSSPLYIPNIGQNITDPSDLFKEKGRLELRKFLYQSKLIYES
jgi:hypothetical protein